MTWHAGCRPWLGMGGLAPTIREETCSRVQVGTALDYPLGGSGGRPCGDCPPKRVEARCQGCLPSWSASCAICPRCASWFRALVGARVSRETVPLHPARRVSPARRRTLRFLGEPVSASPPPRPTPRDRELARQNEPSSSGLPTRRSGTTGDGDTTTTRFRPNVPRQRFGRRSAVSSDGCG